MLFCYPYDISELSEIPKPDGYITIHNNSDNTTTSISFPDTFKGHKRFSNIYAISLTGSSSYNGNQNFEGRLVFPENIIINCVGENTDLKYMYSRNYNFVKKILNFIEKSKKKNIWFI